MSTATRLEKLEGLLGVRPPRVVGAVSWAGRCYSLVYDDGSRGDEADLPVGDLPEGAEHVEADPDREIVSMALGLDGRPTWRHVVGIGWRDVLGRRPGPREVTQ